MNRNTSEGSLQKKRRKEKVNPKKKWSSFKKNNSLNYYPFLENFRYTVLFTLTTSSMKISHIFVIEIIHIFVQRVSSILEHMIERVLLQMLH